LEGVFQLIIKSMVTLFLGIAVVFSGLTGIVATPIRYSIEKDLSEPQYTRQAHLDIIESLGKNLVEQESKYDVIREIDKMKFGQALIIDNVVFVDSNKNAYSMALPDWYKDNDIHKDRMYRTVTRFGKYERCINNRLLGAYFKTIAQPIMADEQVVGVISVTVRVDH